MAFASCSVDLVGTTKPLKLFLINSTFGMMLETIIGDEEAIASSTEIDNPSHNDGFTKILNEDNKKGMSERNPRR